MACDRAHRVAWLLSPFLGLALSGGCAGAAAETGGKARSGGAGAPHERADADGDRSWPRELLAGPGSGPALYLHEGADAPAVGYVSPGVRLRLAGPPKGDRVYVLIEGGMKVRGWLSLGRLAARVQKKGRIGGAPAYVGPGDLVKVLGTTDDGLMRVEVRPWLGRMDGATVGPFVGVYPRERLGADEPRGQEAPSQGRPHRLPAGTEVPVYDKPGGSVVATLPVLDPPLAVVVLREKGAWKGIRAGLGPYLVGYVNVPLSPVDAAEQDLLVGGLSSSGGVPERLRAEDGRPLYKLPKKTRITFDGKTMAILERDGYAREMIRHEETGEVDVFAAVDDDVAIRGMVRSGDLQPAE